MIENFIKFPLVKRKLGLGVGIDMPWGETREGFIANVHDTDDIPEKMKKFLMKYQSSFNYMFVAYQPKNKNIPTASDYYEAYDAVFDIAPRIRAFHHTMLNLGSMEKYDRSYIANFTNELIDRYDFKWVVEDLGIWSIRGKSLPYPLPPVLNNEGLKSCITNINVTQELLSVPLCVEFPGFTEGSNFYIGSIHAFDFFNTVAKETQSPVTIDVGHILSYQWLVGDSGEKMYTNLERLPLDHCFELHLSGCRIYNGKFRDLHHGILLNEQIELLEYFLENCPNLCSITYEDPKFLDNGELIPQSVYNYNRLNSLVGQWAIV